jgi:hypothetical protein
MKKHIKTIIQNNIQNDISPKRGLSDAGLDEYKICEIVDWVINDVPLNFSFSLFV